MFFSQVPIRDPITEQSFRLRSGLLIIMVCLGCFIALWYTQHRTTTREKIAKERLHFVIDINQATIADWCMLPGLGEATATKIIQARETRGGFENVDQLLTVSGLGAHTLTLIRPYVICRVRAAH